MDSGGVLLSNRLSDFTGDSRNMFISPKSFGYGGAGGGMMVSLSASCPNCRHVFPLPGLGVAVSGCGGAPCPRPTPPPLALSLSGGRLLPSPSASPAALSPHALPPFPPLFAPCSPLFAPCSPVPPYTKPPPPEQDLNRLTEAVTHLRLSGWYYEDLTWQASQKALRGCAQGTFLVRDSGDHNYLFSLSVQTAKGPTSVRLHYAGGLFRLDAEPGLAPLMPHFDCVVKLVEHYVRLSAANDAKGESARALGHVWVDSTGGRHSAVVLRRPLVRAPSSLAHLARLAVNKAIREAAPPALPLLPPVRQLGLPASLQKYLEEYPYSC